VPRYALPELARGDGHGAHVFALDDFFNTGTHKRINNLTAADDSSLGAVKRLCWK
jgi:hypothetical protein